MSEWRDMERIPLGMSDFQRWFTPIPSAPKVQPSDIDGLIHNRKFNAFLMLEFKPALESITTGQSITLKGFSELDNCLSLVIIDPNWADDSRKRYSDDTVITVVPFIDGVQQKPRLVTMKALNERIEVWWETGK